MKLLIQSAMIFFGTLMAAAVVAFGEPAQADVAWAKTVRPPQPTLDASGRPASPGLGSTRSGFSPR